MTRETIDNELIDNLLKNYKKPEDLVGENGLLKQLTKQLLERAMVAEMTEHVGYDKHYAAGHHSGNSRKRKSGKTIKGTFGELGELAFSTPYPLHPNPWHCLIRSLPLPVLTRLRTLNENRANRDSRLSSPKVEYVVL